MSSTLIPVPWYSFYKGLDLWNSVAEKDFNLADPEVAESLDQCLKVFGLQGLEFITLPRIAELFFGSPGVIFELNALHGEKKEKTEKEKKNAELVYSPGFTARAMIEWYVSEHPGAMEYSAKQIASAIAIREFDRLPPEVVAELATQHEKTVKIKWAEENFKKNALAEVSAYEERTRLEREDEAGTKLSAEQMDAELMRIFGRTS